MVLAVALLVAATSVGRVYVVDPSASTLEVHVAKAGVLSPFLHDHLFRPDRWNGEVRFDPSAPGSLDATITIDATSMHDHEPALSPSDEHEIDQTAQGPQVLDAKKFPTIRLDAHGMQNGVVLATLTLHGHTRAVRIPVETKAEGHRASATGSFSFKQSDFGIKPYRRALGSVAIKDEVTVRVKLVANAR